MKRAHVFISGSVQGVGYRFFVKSWARKFGVVGRVWNLDDGRVEAIFQGEEREIVNLIEKCRKGPFMAEVKSVDVEWEETEEEYRDFKVAS